MHDGQKEIWPVALHSFLIIQKCLSNSSSRSVSITWAPAQEAYEPISTASAKQSFLHPSFPSPWFSTFQISLVKYSQFDLFLLAWFFVDQNRIKIVPQAKVRKLLGSIIVRSSSLNSIGHFDSHGVKSYLNKCEAWGFEVALQPHSKSEFPNSFRLKITNGDLRKNSLTRQIDLI